GTRGERCLGWIGGISDIVRGNGAAYASIGCERAHAQLEPDETLELRHVRVHARDGFAPLDLRDTVALDAPHDALRAPAPAPIAGPFGIPGIAQIAATTSEGFVPGPGSHVLVLAHGYCADSNPWPLAQFGADAAPYANPNQNMSHDVFARDIAAAAAQFKSYGLVAHSQGGCAGLHLYTFYWSGLDWAGAGRLIQCVGSPFEGTPMAGNLAALGEVFGVQCGANNDMTPAGATAWLSTIPSAPRAAVFTHTTTFTDNWWSFDYCNIVTDAFLSDPEDGVVEHSAGHFPGANDMGIKTGWCHVSGMRDPAQTGDSARNGVMNAQGAR
ncbi:MAG: conditioned medium factor, partial [Phycisphaerales bacterium]